jgi:hypothetical protein
VYSVPEEVGAATAVAIAGLTTVMLVLYYGLTWVLYRCVAGAGSVLLFFLFEAS